MWLELSERMGPGRCGGVDVEVFDWLSMVGGFLSGFVEVFLGLDGCGSSTVRM